MRRTTTLVVFAGAAALLLAGQALKVTVNGKPDPAAIVRDGKVFVSEDALRAAGATVTRAGNSVSVNFQPHAGRNQVEAAEGNQGEWLSNGTWRLRVLKAEPAPNPFGKGPGFKVTLEMRNLAPRALAPFASGLDKLQFVDSKGTTLSFNQASFKDFFKEIAPGNGFTNEVLFGDPSNVVTEVGDPDKLLVLFRTTGGNTLPNFRVNLKSE